MVYLCFVCLTIYTPEFSPRLEYVCHILFGVLLETEWIIKIPPAPGEIPDSYALSYGVRLESVLHIPSSGLLFQKILPEKSPEVYLGTQISGLFPGPEPEADIPFDLFASSFWILLDIWAVQNILPLDSYGRTEDSQHPIFLKGWHTYPIVQKYAEFIAAQFPDSGLGVRKKFSVQTTLDIDEPWKNRYKPLWIQSGGIIKSLLNRDFSGLKEKYQSLILKQDPFDILDKIQLPSNTCLFFLLDRHDVRDGRHTWKNAAYRELILRCRDAGYTLGIHPSFTSSETPGRIQFEKEKLEEITQQKILYSRQHFLRYKNPETFAELEEAGIQHEYSLCPVHFCGYLRGMARAFPWYNIQKEKISRLNLHPVMLMDRALQKYQGYTSSDASRIIIEQAEISRAAGGTFVILWHNTTLSESGEWKGWTKVWSSLTDYIQQYQES